MTPLIIWFERLGISDIPLVGGKNASLGEMYQNLEPLLREMSDLIHQCPCEYGCPSCVGPGSMAKDSVLTLLATGTP